MPVVGNYWMEGKRKGRQEGLLVSMDGCPWEGDGECVGRQSRKKEEQGEWESRKGKVEEKFSYTHYI